MKTKKENILNLVRAMMTNFLYYDRKEDEDFPLPGSIEEAINNSVVSIDEIIDVIRKNLA